MGKAFAFQTFPRPSDAYISWLRLVEAIHVETWMHWAIYDMIKLSNMNTPFKSNILFGFYNTWFEFMKI